jgi:dipeptidyl aminopeptidase/acylaminoacyl peptidase
VTAPALRPPRPDDQPRLRIPTEPRLAPDGDLAVFVLQDVAAAHDAYHSALWSVRLDGGRPIAGEEPRRLTTAGRHESAPRFSPDGRTLAFLSNRRVHVEEEPTAGKDREDSVQVYLLPLDRPGEARRLTDLPRGVTGLEWSPDGKSLAVLSSSRAAERAADDRARRRLPDPKPGQPLPSDYWFFDRLGYELNGPGIVAHQIQQAWIVDAASGEGRRVTDLPAGVAEVAWSPDGKRLAISTGPARDRDLRSGARVLSLDLASGRLTSVVDRPGGIFFSPAWLDNRTIVALGGDGRHAFYRFDLWRFPADGSGARAGENLSGRHDIMPASSMNSDVTIGEGARLFPIENGSAVLFLAPVRGAIELWRLEVASGELQRLTEGRHYLSAIDVRDMGPKGVQVLAMRSSPTETPDLYAGRLTRRGTSRRVELAQVTSVNEAMLGEIELRPAVERTVTVDGREVQGWLISSGKGRRPTVLEIHGGPHTLYGWAPSWEFQVLAGAGISVFYSNPRGSEGYGREFNEANIADWGDGPTRDVLAGVDALVADGLADPARLGVTGGSYGGYLTSWIVGHDQRFAAAITCRSVNDLPMLMLTGDLSGTDWPKYEFGAYPWQDPDLFRRLSPITYARDIHTPLLIQHAEQDLRTTLGQAEALFAVLRRHRRPVRLMRVVGESHELTRSGTPFRRSENLVQVRDWFRHFLVQGKKGLPPKPRTRHGD